MAGGHARRYSTTMIYEISVNGCKPYTTTDTQLAEDESQAGARVTARAQ